MKALWSCEMIGTLTTHTASLESSATLLWPQILHCTVTCFSNWLCCRWIGMTIQTNKTKYPYHPANWMPVLQAWMNQSKPTFWIHQQMTVLLVWSCENDLLIMFLLKKNIRPLNMLHVLWMRLHKNIFKCGSIILDTKMVWIFSCDTMVFKQEVCC